MFIVDILGGCGISMDGGLDKLGRIPGVELGPGVESPLGVGVLDFRPGVPAFSRCQTGRTQGMCHYYRVYIVNRLLGLSKYILKH